ncbi:MAG: thioredoxin family protein [Gemmatimonadetes bacterium]|nr:thioredoxin family protein [Gemmatimonadota bacterium]
MEKTVKKIEILGTGCPKCNQLTENAEAAAREVGGCEVVKVNDVKEIMSRGVTLTPALAVDGELKAAGKLLSSDEIRALLG